MRVTLEIDGRLLDGLMSAEKGTTRSEAVERAVKAYLRRKHLGGIIGPKGQKQLIDHAQRLRRKGIRGTN